VFNLGHGWKYIGMGTIQVCNDFRWKRFSCVIFIYFWQDLINGYVVCLSITVNMARFGNFAIIIMLNLSAFYVQNEMLCTKHITGLFPREQFSNSVVWSGTLYLTTQHYRKTVPSGEDNNRMMLLDFV
jgi:hypothetical protein